MSSVKIVGQVLQHTYRIERLIGEGGMGGVYEASHLRLARRFAVKLLIPSVASNPKALARFRREAEITSGLGHPNIVEVIDFNYTDNGVPYFVMELLHGEDLKTRIDRETPTIDQVASILYQAASALAAAHEKGIIHRDLKPQNIFLCKRGTRDDFVKLVDFGISKVLGADSDLTKTQTLLGTPYYMAPEQAEERAADVDLRTDVYAMGTILYEMLTGRPPFTGSSVPSLLYKITYQEPTPLRTLRPEIPQRVEDVILKALHKKNEKRWDSMDRFWRAFAKAIGKRATGVFEAVRIDGDGKPLADSDQGGIPPDTTPDTQAGPPSHFRAAQKAAQRSTKQSAHSWEVPPKKAKKKVRRKRPKTAEVSEEAILQLIENIKEDTGDRPLPPQSLIDAAKPADKAAADKAAADKAAANKAAADKAAADKAAASKAAADKAAASKTATSKTAEKAVSKETDKTASKTADKAADKTAADKTAADKKKADKTASKTADKADQRRKRPSESKADRRRRIKRRKERRAKEKAREAKIKERQAAEEKQAAQKPAEPPKVEEPEEAAPPETFQSIEDEDSHDSHSSMWDLPSSADSDVSASLFDVSINEPSEPKRDLMASLWDTASKHGTGRGFTEESVDEWPSDESSYTSDESTPDVFHVRRPTSNPFATHTARRSNPFATRDSSEDDSVAESMAPEVSKPTQAEPDEPDDPDAPPTAAMHFDAGLALMREGNVDEAMQEWEKATALDPDNRTYASNLRRLKALRGVDEDDEDDKDGWLHRPSRR